MRPVDESRAGKWVDLWRINLNETDENSAALRFVLSPSECQRADRLRSQDMRRRWTIAHGAMRCILASYCECEPQALRIEAEPKGKPKLVWPSSSISFSLSHTQSLAWLAITDNKRVGVDVEIIDSRVEVAELSRRFFTRNESEQILALPRPQQTRAFFACWTRKEAFLKAIGAGLSLPLNSFEVTVLPDQPARVACSKEFDSNRWRLLDVSETDFAAAIAVEGTMPLVRHRTFKYIPNQFTSV